MKILSTSEKEHDANMHCFRTILQKFMDIQKLTTEIIRKFAEKGFIYQTERVGCYKVQRTSIVWNSLGSSSHPPQRDKKKRHSHIFMTMTFFQRS